MFPLNVLMTRALVSSALTARLSNSFGNVGEEQYMMAFILLSFNCVESVERIERLI